MRSQRKTTTSKKASAVGGHHQQHHLADLLVGIEAGAPARLEELVAAKSIDASRRDEWLEIIRLSVQGVRSAVERGDAIGAAISMHHAQLYSGATIALLRQRDALRSRNIHTAAGRKAKERELDDKLLRREIPNRMLKKPSTLKRRLRRIRERQRKEKQAAPTP